MLISSHSLSVKFGDQRVLDGIDVSIKAGEIVTIVGPNGSGKSTLLKSLIGAIHPYSGEIVRAPDLSIGYVPQRLFIDDTLPMTVARFLNLPNKRSQTVVKEALTNAGVGGFEKKQLKSLSGGQLQRVLLARVLLEKPNLLLLDEATQGLDRRGVSDFYRQVVAVRDALNCAVVMVSHDLHAVMRYSDRVICLNGSICCQGAPQTVLASHAYHALFGLDDDTCQYELDSKAAWLEGVADVG